MVRNLFRVFAGLTVGYLAAAGPLMAQEQPSQSQVQTQPASPCQTDPHFDDFDFWLGTWDVSSPRGDVVGANRIEKAEENCLIKEFWTSKQGGTGFSVNYYDPVTGVWRQVWVSPPGVSIDITGGLKDGSMVLEGTINYYAQGKGFPFRGTWTPNPDGSVRQFFEQYDTDKKTWSPWFEGIYTRTRP